MICRIKPRRLHNYSTKNRFPIIIILERKIFRESDRAYMKKEAATTRPIVIMKTDRVGYQASGTGLEIGFGALKKINRVI